MVTISSSALFTPLTTKWNNLLVYVNRHRRPLLVAVLLAVGCFAWFKPYQFADLWLTKDQQGYLLFKMGKYERASSRFNDTRWQAFSFYGAEQYKQSATLYSQFANKDDLLAQANALAHGQEYVKARDLYQSIIDAFPDYQAAQYNLVLVQTIIDDINRMSESQQPEEGDSPQELGDDPQRADGAEKQEPQAIEIEQLTAEQLLMNPELSEMWLRGVQKNPGQFLAIKFLMQQESQSSVSSAQTDSEVKNDD